MKEIVDILLTAFEKSLDYLIGINNIKEGWDANRILWQPDPLTLYESSYDIVRTVNYEVNTMPTVTFTNNETELTGISSNITRANGELELTGTSAFNVYNRVRIATIIRDEILYQPLDYVYNHPNLQVNNYNPTTATIDITYYPNAYYINTDQNPTWNTFTIGTIDTLDANNIRRNEIRRNLYIQPRKRTALEEAQSEAEERARRSLRDMISERDWRRYVTNGFLVVKSPLGFYYQIFKEQKNINVYHNNKRVASLCIHTDPKCPPTDHVANMKMLIEFDEVSVWKGANAYMEKQATPEILHLSNFANNRINQNRNNIVINNYAVYQGIA